MKIEVNNNIEIPRLEKLLVTCFDELKDDDSENFSEEQEQSFREWFGIDNLKDYLKYSHIIVARDGDKLIGCAIVGMQNPLTWPDGRKYEFFILGVLPEYRKKGIGKKLVETAEKTSRENGAKSLILNTHVLMKQTQKFYTKLGYTKMGILENYYGNGDAIFFVKEL